MRIAISGTACQGKTTLINDFIVNWPCYKRSNESYRKVIKEEQLKINKEANKDGQWKILNCLIDDIQKASQETHVIFDRCPLDNLIYSMRSFEAGASDIDKEFIDKCIPLVSESLKLVDIIFFIPITKVSPVQVSEKNTRDTDSTFINEIDNIFKAVHQQYLRNGGTPFFCADDKPGFIEVFGSPEERIRMIELYLNKSGDLISDDESVLSSENLDLMETLLGIQQKAQKSEKEEKRLRDKFILGK